MTVAPLAWARGDGSSMARLAAAAAPLFLVSGALLERRFGAVARFASLWGFFISCAVVWGVLPAALSRSHLDSPRQIAGTLGWALFAFASSAPPLRPTLRSSPAISDPTLLAHRRLSTGDWVYAAGGALLALSMQLIGLEVVSPERALLVRFVTLAAGLATIAAATDLALARHAPRRPRSARARLRSLLAPIALLAILLLAGVLVADQG